MKDKMRKLNKFSTLGKLAIIFLVLIIFIGIFFPAISTYPHNRPSGQALESPSKEHILGTDDLGIDIFAQIVYGSRVSLIIGLSTAILSGFLGSTIGIIAGYYGGIVDSFIMRIIDLLLALPELPVMILLGAFLGPSSKNIVIVLSLFSWIRPARIVRSKVISIKEEAFIKAAESYGAGFIYLTKYHFLKEIFPIMSISMIRITSRAIISEASLSFLGLGDPTSKSWGILLNHALSFKGIYFTDYWKWWVLTPLTFIILLVLSISFISRDLEGIFNEKL